MPHGPYHPAVAAYLGKLMNEDPLSQIQEYRAPTPTPCGRLIGCAGTGKSYTLCERMHADPDWATLTSTTGISAINIGAATLNSTLGYFDTASLRDAMIQGRLDRKLRKLAEKSRVLVIEEYSMLDAEALDIIVHALDHANAATGFNGRRPLGLLLVGDLAQLPPVKAKWVFTAGTWPRVAANTEKLTKVWRQGAGRFLDGLNCMRIGLGEEAECYLRDGGLEFHPMLDTDFDGTTILPKNRSVDDYNWDRLRRLPGASFTLVNRRWGKERSEWGLSPRTREWGIPERVELKVGARVMLLANQMSDGYVNGDCGWIVGHVKPKGSQYAEPGECEHLIVKLDTRDSRNGNEINVSPVVRNCDQSDEPWDWPSNSLRIPRRESEEGEYPCWTPEPHYVVRDEKYVMGQIEFWPVRLAYASTVHKSQSLTLDRVQIDIRDRFFGAPAMMYVALSRCRTLEGLRVVGDPDRFVSQVKVDKAVLPWI